MSRHIDVDALGIGKADRNAFTAPEYADGWNSAIEIIENAPTADVVEVVRCKDCIYSFMSISGEYVLYCDMRPSDDHLNLKKDYFCSDGKRKGE